MSDNIIQHRLLTSPELYQCKRCERLLTRDRFDIRKSNSRPRKDRCKDCRNKENRENPLKKEQQVIRQKRYMEKHPDRRHDTYIKSKHKTKNVYSVMLANQNNKCAICKTEDSGRGNSDRLMYDHCHQCGEGRGLLCHQCNIGFNWDKVESWGYLAEIYKSLHKCEV